VSRSKITLFVILAVAGTIAMVLYAAVVFPAAPSSFQLAILVFTGIAAVVGFLGLILSYLTYRIEAGRVPRPDIAIKSPDGTWGKSLSLEAAFIEPTEAFEDLVNERKRELDEAANTERPHPLVGGFISAGFNYDLGRYKRDVEEHLKEYRDYLEMKELWDTFWRRSYVTVFGFSNEKAGVPASGIKVEIHFPEEDDGIRILRFADLPERPAEPDQPRPPKPDATLGLGIDLQRFTPPVPRIDFPDVSPPGTCRVRRSVAAPYSSRTPFKNCCTTRSRPPTTTRSCSPSYVRGNGPSPTRYTRAICPHQRRAP
jgi:hypothetical protein